MKIKKKGDAFIAVRTEKGELGADFAEVGSEIARISITTGRISGGTGASAQLRQHLNEYLQPYQDKHDQLVDEVIEQIKADANAGDVTVLDELLRMIRTTNLIQALPEERWSEYDSIKGFFKDDY